MRHSTTNGHRGILLIALMVGILLGSLIVVALLRSPVSSIGISLTSAGPCSFVIEQVGGTPIAHTLTHAGGIPGNDIQGAVSVTMDKFLPQLIRPLVLNGGGTLCFTNGEYDYAGPVNIVGHGIFVLSLGYSRNFGDAPTTGPGNNPPYFKATAAMNCMLCWGDNGTKQYNGVGIEGIHMDGNGLARYLINILSIQDFRANHNVFENAWGYEIHAYSAISGGMSNSHFENNLFATLDQVLGGSSGAGGLFLDYGIAQSWILNNWVGNAFGKAILIDAFSSQDHVTGNYIEQVRTGTAGNAYDGTAMFIGSGGAIVTDNIVRFADFNCWYGDGLLTLVANNVCQYPNQANNSFGGCWYLEGNSGSITFTNNNCLDTTSKMKYGFILALGSGATGIRITGGTITGQQVSYFFIGGSVPMATLTITNVGGFNPQPDTTVTAGTSPWTYTDLDGYPELMYLKTIAGISALTCNGQSGFAIAAGSECLLYPGETMVVTWAVT